MYDFHATTLCSCSDPQENLAGHPYLLINQPISEGIPGGIASIVQYVAQYRDHCADGSERGRSHRATEDHDTTRKGEDTDSMPGL